MVCLVLTYGVPNGDPLKDENLDRYTKEILDWIAKNSSGQESRVIVNGGATNPRHPQTTEAESFCTAFQGNIQNNPLEKICTIMSINTPDVLDLWDSLHNFRKVVVTAPNNNKRLVLFCEKHRYWKVRFLVSRIMNDHEIKIIPIDFDTRRYTIFDHVARYVEVFFSVLSWYFPWFYDHVERPRRMKKIGRG